MVTFLCFIVSTALSINDPNQKEYPGWLKLKQQGGFEHFLNQDQLNIKKTRKIQILTPFANTIKREDGTYECKTGFISEGPIDSRGCWQCNKTCKKNSMCAFPGLCLVPTPLITKVSKKGKSSLFLTFYVFGKSSLFSPVEAFCKTGNGDSYPAVSVSSEIVKCETDSSAEKSETKKHLTNKIQISFDGNVWSDPFDIEGKHEKENTDIGNKKNRDNINNNYNFSFFLFVKIIVFFVLFVATVFVFFRIFCDKSRKLTTKEQMLQEETMPMAFFPEIREK